MSIRSRFLQIALYFMAAATLVSTVVVYAHAARKGAPVPEALNVPEGHKLKLALLGVGVQRYECAADSGSYAWKFVEPEADLLDHKGHVVGHHSAGPTWTSEDGSSVRAKKRAEVSVAASSIPWLLLEAASHEGKGNFDDIAFIQRVDTEGGLALETSCSQANLGEQASASYRALYKFYKAVSRDKR
jgi:hypothetical protein